jgi:hypothetical protein
MLEPNRKLYLHDNNLALEAVSVFLPIKRYLSNSNRRNVTQRIKQRILELENLFTQNIIKEEWIKNEISKIIDPVKIGLSNLQDTYLDDSQIRAHLDLFIARLEYVRQSNDL